MKLFEFLIWCNQCLLNHFRQEERLNSVFSTEEFSLDDGEKLLKDMQDLREDLSRYGNIVNSLLQRSREIIPIEQRSKPVRRSIPVTAICVYKQVTVSQYSFTLINIINTFTLHSLFYERVKISDDFSNTP